MSRKAQQSSDWDYRVVQDKLERHGKTIPGYFGNFREDTGECLGTTSEQYGIIQNADLLDAAKAALAARGLKGYKERVVVAGSGERMFASYTFKDNTIKSAVGDIFGYVLTVKNSFDRTLRGAIALGFLRLACLNGMATLEKDFNVTKKHSSKVTVDFVGNAIDKAMEHGKTALAVFETMSKTIITNEQGVNILRHLEAAKVLSGTLREEIETLWLHPSRKEDKGRHLYSLYNAVTEHLTHKVSDERFEYAGKVSNNVLLRLVNASRNPQKLAKIVVPLPEDGITLKVDGNVVAAATGAGTTLIVGS